ncbi:SDR family oxidoreductase [Methanoculleus sp.]|uniref:SDR family oxidoreductase n=1 Tax=Methanoculleus sp. TaxID=90427 RepID=UPI002FC7EF0F
MRYIVTGGAGFIGSNLAARLARDDHDVVIIDDLSTGRHENVEYLASLPRVTFIEGSVTDLSLLIDACAGADGIFHQAAIASVPRSVKDPLETNAVNVGGSVNVLWAAKECGVPAVVAASTSAIYGDDPVFPKLETMAPTPLSPYAASKLAGEYYGKVFSDLYGIRTIFLRYFNVFGPRQDPNSEYAAVIPKFITRLLDGKPPIIYGDGEQTRDFIFVADVVQANIKAMESGASGVYNIAGGRRISLNELAGNLSAITGIHHRPIYEPPRTGDVRDSLADISRARETFDFSPIYSLDEGLRETSAWFRGGRSSIHR